MNSKKKAKRSLKLYAILDKTVLKNSIGKALGTAIRKGCDLVQLRDKPGRTREFLRLSKKAAKIVKKHKKVFLINDRIDIAKAVNADGAHLGKGDFSIKLARRLLGKNAIIGKTAHSYREALRAEKEGADYVSIGPVFKTSFKKGLKPRGIGFVKGIRSRIKTPIFCVGGINSANIGRFHDLGIEGVAMIRGIFSHDVNRKV